MSATLSAACGGATESESSDSAASAVGGTGGTGAADGTTGTAGTTQTSAGGSVTSDTTQTATSAGGNVAVVSVAGSGVPCGANQQECYPVEDVRVLQGLGAAGAPPGWSCPETISTAACGSILVSETETTCCYSLTMCCLAGRPYVVAGQARVADTALRSDWLAQSRVPEPSAEAGSELAAELRSELSQAWLEDGQFEHASVAAFARLALELLALGAPAELVLAATRAAADEVEHARLCFGLAQRYSGVPRGPAELPVDAQFETPSLVALAVATVHEGCVAETTAAALAAEQLAVAEDPAVIEALTSIARDEARHAELAYRIVAWAMARGGAEVRQAVAEAFHNSAETLPAAGNTSLDARALNAHGRLTRAQSLRIAQTTREQVIEPCRRALLGGQLGSCQAASAASTLPLA